MINTSSTARLILALGSVLIAGCSTPADQRSPGQPPAGPAPMAVKTPVSINAEMVRIVDHASHELWNVEREGMAPKTDADWENVVEHATQVAAAGVLIRLEGTGVNDRTFVEQPDWQKFAAAVSGTSLMLSRRSLIKGAIAAGALFPQPATCSANDLRISSRVR